MVRIDADAVAGLAGALPEQPPRAEVRRSATVQSVDRDGTVWVTVAGTDEPVPCSSTTASVRAGDSVTVEWRAGALHVTGNATEPAVGGREVAEVVDGRTSAMAGDVEQAHGLAAAAERIARAVGQHFWFDDSGAHVSTEAGNPTGAQNTIWNALGMLFRAGTSNLLAIVTGGDPGVVVYDGDGNSEGNIIARLLGSGAQIGRDDDSHLALDYHSMRLIDRDGNTYFLVRDLREEDGYVTTSETFEGDGTTRSFYLTHSADGAMVSVTVDGAETSAYTYSEPDEGEYQLAFATAPASGATIVVAYRYEGDGSQKSYTLGTRTGANGAYSVAEGQGVEASGEVSHAGGRGTVAVGRDQTAIGRYNQRDPMTNGAGDYALLIGNGTSDSSRSNALAVAWNGNMTAGTYNGVDVTKLNRVGTTYDDSLNGVNTPTANIDSLVAGPSISIPAGTYVITAQWTFAGVSSGRVTQCAIGTSTSNLYRRQRTVQGAGNFCTVQCTCVRTVSATTRVYAYGSNSVACTNNTNTQYITAVRIA